MLLTTKAIPNIRKLYHKVNQVLDRKETVVLDRVLAVDSLNKSPKFTLNLKTGVRDPEVTAVHEVNEELFLVLGVCNRVPDLS